MSSDDEFLQDVKRDRRLKRLLQFYLSGTITLERLKDIANRMWNSDKQDAVETAEKILKGKK